MKSVKSQNQIQSPCSQLVIDWCLTKLKQLEQNKKPALIRELGTWIAYVITYQYRYEEKIIDSGYDISAHAYATQERYDLNCYETVGDFLQECNGNTIATYLSGFGFRTENYEHDVFNWVEGEYNAWLVELMTLIAQGKQPAPLEVVNYVELLQMEDEKLWLSRIWDDFLKNLVELYENFINEFENMNLKFVYRKYLALAQQQQVTKVKTLEEERLLAKKREQISQRIERYFKLLCPIHKKMTMAEQEIAFQVINKLSQPPQKFTQQEISYFVHSSYFATHVSNRLKELCRIKLG